jgi:FkbM family methyltransferase
MHTELAGTGEKKFFKRLATYGYRPSVIYDIGASDGKWSVATSEIFPAAAYHLFEPLVGHFPKYDGPMMAALKKHPKFTLHPVALGNKTGSVTLHVTNDGVSSSVHEMDPTQVRKADVPLWRLDEYVAQKALPLPSIIKMDVQGFEAFVLDGCGQLLFGRPDVLFLETWFVRGYGPDTPLITEIVAALAPHDFVLVDLCYPYYGAQRELTSIDAFFLSKRLLEGIKQPSNGWKW